MASRARAEGICDYRLWTTEELIEAYAWEAGRINQEDRKRTQRLIKQELKRRFDGPRKGPFARTLLHSFCPRYLCTLFSGLTCYISGLE